MKRARGLAVGIGLALPVSLFALAVLAACGSRTGLLVPDEVAVTEPDGAIIYVQPGVDASDDVFEPLDALPIIDTSVPDAVPPSVCADASNTLIYVVTQSNALLRFDPSSGAFSNIGQLACPDARSPFSMAVNHLGVGYVLYYDDTATTTGLPAAPGSIYRVDLTNAHCEATTYVPGQLGFDKFGMSFSLDTKGVETLYVASDNVDSSGNATGTGSLGAIDPTTFALRLVGTFNPTVPAAELTGTGDGRLFGFYAPGGPGSTNGSAIAQIDPTTAQVTAQDTLPTLNQGDGWAFGFWGGNFYTFTDPDETQESVVTRYDPASGALTTVARYPDLIVGAGVSTCAPAQ